MHIHIPMTADKCALSVAVNDPAQYRSLAAHCQKMAAGTARLDVKGQWLNSAQWWLELARSRERVPLDKVPRRSQGTGQEESKTSH
jgi:hypothetical protein